MNYFIPHREMYKVNKLTWLPMCGFIAQLVEHCTGIRGGHLFSCLNWKIYCDDHTLLSSMLKIIVQKCIFL